MATISCHVSVVAVDETFQQKQTLFQSVSGSQYRAEVSSRQHHTVECCVFCSLSLSLVKRYNIIYQEDVVCGKNNKQQVAIVSHRLT